MIAIGAVKMQLMQRRERRKKNKEEGEGNADDCKSPAAALDRQLMRAPVPFCYALHSLSFAFRFVAAAAIHL
jgi:hypothetical protein